MPNFPRPIYRALSLGCFVTLVTLGFSAKAYALANETNQGRWEKPCTLGPDKVVPGFLVNLGPTGARGTLTKQSFIVKFIFPDTPATNVLKLGDEVCGASNGIATLTFSQIPIASAPPIR